MARALSESIRHIASVVDPPRQTLCPAVWSLKSIPPRLRPPLRENIIERFVKAVTDAGLTISDDSITGLYVAGSLTGQSYRNDSDLDIDVVYDMQGLREDNEGRLTGMTDEEVHEYLKNAVQSANDREVPGTSHRYSFMLLEPGDMPRSAGVYDVIRDRWIRGPAMISQSFDPDVAFSEEKAQAMKIRAAVEALIQSIIDVSDRIKYAGGAEKQDLTSALRGLCALLDRWHHYIRSLPKKAQKPSKRYPSYHLGPDWEHNNIVFKWLSKMGYSYPVHVLFERMRGDPMLKVLDNIIPD